MFPIHELELEALRVPVNRLRNTLTEAEQLPHLLIRADKPVVTQIGECSNAFLDRRSVEPVDLSAVFELIDCR